MKRSTEPTKLAVVCSRQRKRTRFEKMGISIPPLGIKTSAMKRSTEPTKSAVVCSRQRKGTRFEKMGISIPPPDIQGKCLALLRKNILPPPLLKERGMNKVNIPPPNNFRVIRIQTEYARSIRETTFSP